MRALCILTSVAAIASLIAGASGIVALPLPASIRIAATFGGLLLTMAALCLARHCSREPLFQSRTLAFVVQPVIPAIVFAAIACMAISLVYRPGRGAPVEGWNVLHKSPPYLLDQHGEMTAVSRQEFLIKAICSGVGWHAALSGAALGALYCAVFARVPWPLNHAELRDD